MPRATLANVIPSPARARRARLILLSVTLAVLTAACGGSSGPAASPTPPPATTGSPGTSPGGSAAACPTAAAPAEVPGWQVATGDPSVFPTLISSQQVCGRNRFLFGFIDRQNQPAATPDRTASVGFYNLARDPNTPVATVTGRFQWLLEGRTGIYVADIEYLEAGEWGAEFVTILDGGTPEVIRARFQVHEQGIAPGIGDPVPSEKTPTLADVGGDVTKISSDTTPEPRLYEVSLDQALAERRPIVLAFATPAFCKSQTCGPMLDVVKAAAKDQPDVAFINVEPYLLAFTDGRLQPVLDANNQLQAAPVTLAFGIPSEPWVFVVDRAGLVTGSFEATVGTDELNAAIAAAK